METYEPAVVFLAYPNNPTANLFDAGAIVEIIRAAPGLVVVDEAYAPFTDASFMPRLGEFDNLVVTQHESTLRRIIASAELPDGIRYQARPLDAVPLLGRVNWDKAATKAIAGGIIGAVKTGH